MLTNTLLAYVWKLKLLNKDVFCGSVVRSIKWLAFYVISYQKVSRFLKHQASLDVLNLGWSSSVDSNFFPYKKMALCSSHISLRTMLFASQSIEGKYSYCSKINRMQIWMLAKSQTVYLMMFYLIVYFFCFIAGDFSFEVQLCSGIILAIFVFLKLL